MDIVYIKENLYKCRFEKIIDKFVSIFNIIKNDKLEELNIYKLPKINNKNYKRVAKKLSKILAIKNIENIVLSENLMNEEKFKNILYSKNINILDGKWLFKFLILDSIKYICELVNINIKNQEISILVNDNTDINIYNINLIANEVKRINIITNNIHKFVKLEKELEEKLGMSITISNNKRKSLYKSKIIINIDFTENIINEYVINRNAIIINVENKLGIYSKSFSGININNYTIEVGEKISSINNEFKKETVYESYIYKKMNIKKIFDKIQEDNVKVESLIGSNGIIDISEFKNLYLGT